MQLISHYLLSGDVEINSCPVYSICPCAFCELPVDYGMKTLWQCDQCDVWYHNMCISMCTQNDNLENNSISYICLNVKKATGPDNISARVMS